MGFIRRHSAGAASGAKAPHEPHLEPTQQRTPLGVCRACATIVYTGDTLAMAGGYLLHGECCAETPPRGELL